MKLTDVLTPSLLALHKPRRTLAPMWQSRLSADSAFCRAAVAMGYLTAEQMAQAAARYRLGRSRRDGVIFWQIDQLEQVCDGKIMYYKPDCHRDHQRHPNWVSNLLKRHYGCEDVEIPTTHCLFGQHLLRDEPPHGGRSIAVVEAEKTAVILSAHFHDSLWMATGGLYELTPVKLMPLRGRQVVLFPDTDPQRKAYSLWCDMARKACRDYGVQVSVSALLERRATADQRQRKIDLTDYLFEGGDMPP